MVYHDFVFSFGINLSISLKYDLIYIFRKVLFFLDFKFKGFFGGGLFWIILCV